MWNGPARGIMDRCFYHTAFLIVVEEKRINFGMIAVIGS